MAKMYCPKKWYFNKGRSKPFETAAPFYYVYEYEALNDKDLKAALAYDPCQSNYDIINWNAVAFFRPVSKRLGADDNPVCVPHVIRERRR